jgi:hypothetical protein
MEERRGQLKLSADIASTPPERQRSEDDTADHFAIEADEGESLLEEVIDVVDAGPEVEEDLPEAIRELRSQMAAVFGFDAAATASHPRNAGSQDHDAPADETDDEDDSTADHETAQEATADGDETPVRRVGGSAASVGLDADDPDSIISYMQGLYSNDQVRARTGGETQGDDEDEGNQPSPAEEAADALSDVTAAVAESSEDEAPVVDAHSVQEARLLAAAEQQQQAKLAADLEREKLNSLREVANLSARSALAQHASTELKNTLLAQGLVTGMSVTVTIVLLASPVWSDSSMVHWGILSAIVSGVMIWKTLQTTARMQNHRSAKRSRKNAQQDAESATGENADEALQPGTDGLAGAVDDAPCDALASDTPLCDALASDDSLATDGPVADADTRDNPVDRVGPSVTTAQPVEAATVEQGATGRDGAGDSAVAEARPSSAEADAGGAQPERHPQQ